MSARKASSEAWLQHLLHSHNTKKATVKKPAPDTPRIKLTKVHRDHISRRTLEYYHIPWEYDKTDSGYIVIQGEFDNDQFDRLFEHTSQLRSGRTERRIQEYDEGRAASHLQTQRQTELRSGEKDMLCDSCKKIPFDDIEGMDNDLRFDLGTVDEVQARRSCPFCRLSTSAMRSLPVRWGRTADYTSDRTLDRVEGSAKVTATWYPHRGGFFIKSLSPQDTKIEFESRDRSPQRGARIATGSQLDSRLLLHWISTCERDHGDRCAPALSVSAKTTDTSSQIKTFRVIDVQANCVINAPAGCRYLALSYVWGQVPAVRLSQKNQDSMMTHGGLLQVRESLPKTVIDAIDLVRMLNERYLWIDALCLIQDNEADMQEGIQRMDIVYENAVMTVIGAVGVDASGGLPGVQHNSRRCTQQFAEVTPGNRMVVTHGLDDYLNNSEYTRRAWTFQEQVLSTRKLVFIDNRVYFRCNQRTWSEENAYNDYSLDRWDRLIGIGSMIEALLMLGSSAWDKYNVLLFYYSCRKLSDQNDAVNAMPGLLRRIVDQMGGQVLEGLPTACFDAGLAFVSQFHKLQRRPAFPSYSWAGWIGGVIMPYQTELCWSGMESQDSSTDWIDAHTWIVWYKRSPNGNVSLISDATETGHIRRRPFGPRHCFLPDTTRTTPTPYYTSLAQSRPYHLLQFWTAAVYFTLSFTPGYASGKLRSHSVEQSPIIVDREGKIAGRVFLDSNVPDTSLFEFILLSRFHYNQDSDRPWLPSPDTLDCSSEPKPEPSQWNVYFVLLIERNGGIAERRGIGQIYESAVDHSFPPGPVWKEIVLG